MRQRIRFRGVLWLTLVSVTLGGMTLLGSLSFGLYRRNLEAASAALARQTISRVTDRLDELVRTAINHQVLFPDLAPQGQLSSSDFLQICERLLLTVEPHPELSYLGVGIAETGEYAVLGHPSGTPMTVRMYVRDPDTGPEIREYRPVHGHLELINVQPWMPDGNPNVTFSLKSRPFYQQAEAAGKAVWTDSYEFWAFTGAVRTRGVTFASPIYDPEGRLSLVWDIDLELESLSQFLERVQSQVPGKLLIAEHRRDTTWRLIAESPAQDENVSSNKGDTAAMEAFIRSLPAEFSEVAGGEGQMSLTTAGGREWKASYAVLEGPDRPRWLIAELWPEDATPRALSLASWEFLVTFSGVGVIATWLAWQVSRSVSAPLQALEQEARFLGLAERTRMPIVGGPEEIDRLAGTLNHMAEKLQQRQAALEQANAELRVSRERLQNHIDRTPVGVLEIDMAGRVVSWNPAAEQIFGWTADEIRGQHYEVFVPEFIRSEIRHVAEKVMNHPGVFRNDNQNVTKDGRIIDCEWYNTPLLDENGEIYGIACLVLDVTQRKQAAEQNQRLKQELEDRVRQRTEELQFALRDLEAFSYSVAHDLRAPLRSIDGFSQALVEDCGPLLPLEGIDHLQRIRFAARRMGELIDSLLRLARVGRQEIQREPVDLSQLARHTLARLQQAVPHRKVEQRIAPNLTAIGDRQMLKVLLENILDNAWKYTRHADTPVIELFAEDRPDGRWYVVRDNGVGFDPAYADKALEPFQRLHHVDQFEGHGIGLATAARIVEKHQGAIRLVPRLEGGAECWFRLEPARTSPPVAAD